jgi:hypothetical protein
LSIVLVTALLVAGLAIPHLLQSRIAANEATAIGALRAYNTAMLTYRWEYPAVGFPESLVALGPPAGGAESGSGADGILDRVLGAASPSKAGYAFALARPGPKAYAITAAPLEPGTTGKRFFYTDQTGVIRYNNAAPATALDNPL